MARRRRRDLAVLPDDPLVTLTFSQRKHGEGFLCADAPERSARVRWETLRAERIHMIDCPLRGRYADLVFTAAMNDGGARLSVHALVQRKSTVDALVALLWYLDTTHRRLGRKRITNLLLETATAGQNEVGMSFSDHLIQLERKEGRWDGRAEGRRRGRAEMLLELLAARFGAVPDAVQARILAAPEPTLARWCLRVLTAPTLDAVLEGASSPRPTKKPPAPKRRATPRKRTRTAD